MEKDKQVEMECMDKSRKWWQFFSDNRR